MRLLRAIRVFGAAFLIGIAAPGFGQTDPTVTPFAPPARDETVRKLAKRKKPIATPKPTPTPKPTSAKGDGKPGKATPTPAKPTATPKKSAAAPIKSPKPTKAPTPTPAPRLEVLSIESSGHVALWIDRAGEAEFLTDPKTRTQTLQKLRADGYTAICVEALDAESRRRFVDRDGATQLRRLIDDAHRAGLAAILVHRPLAAPAGSDVALLQESWEARDSETSPTVVRSDRRAGHLAAEWSPASEVVRRAIVADITALAELRPDAVMLANFGFAGAGADVSASARESFEFFARRSVKQWPADVLEGGAARRDWLKWRSTTLRDLVLDVRGACVAPGGKRIPLGLLTEGPYAIGGARGLDWANGSGASGESSVRTGHLFDFVAVGTWAPAQTEAEGVREGLREGVAAEAAMREAPLGNVPRWSALLLPSLAPGDDAAARLRARRSVSDGVVVLSLGDVMKASAEAP